MPSEVLLSTAYLPPAEYFSLIRAAGKVSIEKEENYIRQTYRNRCRILTPGGIMNLSVPVMKPVPKNLVKDIVIDYSKRWQQVHLRALKASYGRSPYYQYYSDGFEKIILKRQRFLLDLNTELLRECLNFLKIDHRISFTDSFAAPDDVKNDPRYSISPGKPSGYRCKPYIQVFTTGGFVPGLSILDILFNTGPDANDYF
jgi:hypothetical protein